ncbi:MAG: YjjG family noncanonical pyrimidine nucleotidase [Eubacterium sp.]|nr:YjjG family noncanonical pyrimidine nucleotidase [Eubacterium sp.]
MFKILLWDLDNTLLDFREAEAYSIKKRFEEYGLGVLDDEAVARYSKINDYYWQRLETGEMSKEHILEARFETFFKNEGIIFDRIKSFNIDYENGLADKIFYNENGYEIVKSLTGKYKQYAVTNGAYTVQSVRLEKSGFGALFDGAFISDKVGFEKPSVEFFNTVLKSIPSCDKSEILIIGDSLTSDMKGGNNAGIKTCWYNPYENKNTKKVHIDYEIKSLNEIYKII